MKRLCATLALLLVLLSGCQRQPDPPKAEFKRIYATFYPLYALAERVIRGVPELELATLIQPQDGCLRSYELSEWDIAKIASADAIILGGRGLETFEGALMDQEGGGVAAVSAMNGLKLIGQDENVDGEMESHLQGANPWLFLSVVGAKEIMESIAAGMVGLDPGYQDLYADNLLHGQQELDALQLRMGDSLIRVTPVPVALMHEGLVYLADDLGLNVVCQIDREPATPLYENDLKAALDQLQKSGAQIVLIEKQAPDQLKSALTDAGYPLALIDTLSTFPPSAGFDHYIDAMLSNAQSIATAFTAAT